jgi:hypothetical protein
MSTLQEMREDANRKVVPARRQKVDVRPGVSITEEDVLKAGKLL